MSIKDTPDEPLAGGSAFQNAWQQVLKSYVPPVAEQAPSPPPSSEQKDVSMPEQHDPVFDTLPFPTSDTPSAGGMSDAEFVSELSIARLTANQYCEQHTLPAASLTASCTTTDPIMNTATLESPTADTACAASEQPAVANLNLDDTDALVGYKVTNVYDGLGVMCEVRSESETQHAAAQQDEDALGKELTDLNDVSHRPTPPRVDMTRLARNEQFKIINQQQSEGNKRQPGQPRPPRAPRLQSPAVPKVSKPSVPLQSEKARNYLREAMRQPGLSVDGEDHINTSSSAATRLGQALEINAHIPFHHPDLGPFKSVGGLWYFVGGETQNEAFRALFGKACRMQGKNTKMRDVQGFKTIIAEATWITVRSEPAFEKAMAESTLPFRCYYLQGELNLPVASLTEDWYMPILEEIRRTLQAIGQTGDASLFPDFSFLEARPRQEKKRHRPRY